MNVTTVDANGDSIPDLDGDGNPILNIDTVFFDLGTQTWSKDPSGAPRTDMTLIPDSTEIIPIYVASGEQILEATTGTEQDGVPGILTFDDLEVVFNTSTGRVVEGKEGYITTNLTYTHPELTYDLLDTLFVGTDLTGIPKKLTKIQIQVKSLGPCGYEIYRALRTEHRCYHCDGRSYEPTASIKTYRSYSDSRS